ncbi:small serum protein 2-like isoform X2 [Rhinatrema bivittatum]|uniref:small serum protein 2-like isoform X2 n=1 Tax=Rhinatrema bivittatum TaxID=194408 RepID=UPI0011282155|nr:small serum protein 2-like isoform X2 [Rhinatrema bivittatum]
MLRGPVFHRQAKRPYLLETHVTCRQMGNEDIRLWISLCMSRHVQEVLGCLVVLCTAVGLTDSACFHISHRMRQLPGKRGEDGTRPVLDLQAGPAFSVSCLDPYDRSEHSIGDSWKTAHCFVCSCKIISMECCAKYNGFETAPEGCKSVLDSEKCVYKFYRINDPGIACNP